MNYDNICMRILIQNSCSQLRSATNTITVIKVGVFFCLVELLDADEGREDAARTLQKLRDDQIGE